MTMVRRAVSSSGPAEGARAWGCAAIALALAGCAAPSWGEGESGDLAYGEARVAGGRGSARAAVHVELARVYFEQGVLDVAQHEAGLAHEIDASNHDAPHLLALIALQQAEPERAGRLFESALDARGGRADRVLARNYAHFRCEYMQRCAKRESQATESQATETGQLRAQSIAIDNSPASDANRNPRNTGRTGQSQQATGGAMKRWTTQEYSSEEPRDE